MDAINQDISSRKKLVSATVIAEAGKPVTIIPVESLAGADPYQSLSVLCNGCNASETQAILDGECLTGRKSLCIKGRCKH